MEAKENLQLESFVALLDKGYHNGKEIKQCEDAKIVTIVAPSAIVNSNLHGTTPDYVVTNFIYHENTDTYTCPEGRTLSTTGTWHKNPEEEIRVINLKNIEHQIAKPVR
ncbi:MAG: hypothetical protein IPN15_16240 [Saprospiraceae bacterium]|nr:hypothetical protein [Candidatus Vicinibacter affinis]